MCDFGPDPSAPDTYPLYAGPCAVLPEMIKRRHSLVLSVQEQMIIVAPFSTVEPTPLRQFHLEVPADTYPFFATGARNWLKGDMIMAVSRQRLDRIFYEGRYKRASICPEHFALARACVLHGLSLGKLVPHL